MPSGIPMMAPGRAGSSAAIERPAVTCPAVAPSARSKAEENLPSAAVAQPMKVVFTAARMTSITVMMVVSSLKRSSFRLLMVRLAIGVWAWLARMATMPVTVVVMLADVEHPPKRARASAGI